MASRLVREPGGVLPAFWLAPERASHRACARPLLELGWVRLLPQLAGARLLLVLVLGWVRLLPELASGERALSLAVLRSPLGQAALRQVPGPAA